MGNVKVKVYQVVEAILYRLKTGCQWRQLPVKQFFRRQDRWQSVNHHFQKWSKDGSWQKVLQYILDNYKSLLDMSGIQLDGTHTPAKPGGEALGYHGRKKCKTSNMLILPDSNGIPLACSNPVAGNHNDAFEPGETFEQMVSDIKLSGIKTDGLFLKADAGFYSTDFRQCCGRNEIIDNIDQNKRNGAGMDQLFDKLLYRYPFVVERTNAWLDAFKAILVRYETNKIHWKVLNLMAFCKIIFLRF